MLLRQRLLGIALASSLLIHAICALLIPAFTDRPSLEPVDIVSFARVRRTEIVRHDLAAHHAAKRATRIAHAILAVPGPRPIHRIQAPPIAAPSAAIAMNKAPVENPADRDATGSATEASPMPQATAPATIHEETAPQEQPVSGGYMPFGADEPDPVIDPKSLQALQALGVHVTLTVTVGDDGKTKNVSFHPPLDPQLEAQVRALLVAANWDPAYCGGGVPCQKDTSITL